MTIGNLSSSTPGGSYTYSSTGYTNPHAPTNINGVTYTYDSNGNLTQGGIWSHSFNYRNFLTQSGNGTATTTYAYDNEGQRVKKVSSGITTFYPSRQYNISSATSTIQIFDNTGALVGTIESTGAATSTRFVHTNHLQGTQVVTDGNAEIIQTIDYYPYGEKRINSGTDVSQREFIGEHFDENTLLSYLNARYYDGGRGQFLSHDPMFWSTKQNLQNPQILNSYSYAENNPIVKSDPSGKCVGPLAVVCIGAGAAMAAQYGYDVYNNIQSNGFSFSDLYSNLSSGETYLTRAAQGASVATVGLLTGGASIPAQIAIMGGTSGLSGVAGNMVLGEPVTPQSVFWDTTIGGLTFGLGKFVPSIPGRMPNFGSEAFFVGKHAQQSIQRLGVDAFSGYISQLYGNFGNTYQTRSSAVQTFNTNVGASAPQDKLWTTPSGAVVTWGGELVVGPTAQSTPSITK